MLNRAMKVSSSFVQSRGTSEYVPQYASQSREVLGVLKQLLEEMNSDIAAAEAAEQETAQETKLSSDRNTTELEKTQEPLGEQEALLANLNTICSDAQTTFDARHAEQLAEIQPIAETIEILMEDQARDHFSKTNSSSLIRPTCRTFPPLGRGSAFGVWLERRAELEEAAVELDAARTTAKIFAIQLKSSRCAEEEERSACAVLRNRIEASQASKR